MRAFLNLRLVFVVRPAVSAAVALLLFTSTGSQAGTTNLATAPDWTLRNLAGETVRFADFRGKVVVLNFWASWCGPCRKEIPGLIELQKRYAARGLTVIGISLDDEIRFAESTVETLHVNYPVVMANPAVTASYGNVSTVPSTFVINKEGNIIALHEGLAEMAVIEREIKPLL